MITFGSLYEQDSFEAVPTAVVEHTKDNLFHLVMDAMAEADKPILTLTYCSEEEAYELLENGDVRDIIVIDPVSDTGEDGVSDTSGTDIAAFLREYLSSDGVMEGLDEESNAFLKDFLESSDKSYLEKLVEGVSGSTLIPETRLSLKIKSNGMGATMLKKMAEMYQTMQKAGRDIMENAMSGVTIASSLQANLSPVGARRECAGTPKFKILLADLLGYYVSHSFCMIIAVSFVPFVLGTDFGSRLLYVYLGAILCCSCAARFLALGNNGVAEAESYEGRLPQRVSLMGMYSYGEFCPVGDENWCNVFHNSTFTILCI